MYKSESLQSNQVFKNEITVDPTKKGELRP